jgi:fructosamine-3-kinase
MHASLRQELSQALASEPEHFESVSGGCISDAFLCRLADGRKIFVKTKEHCDPEMFRAEARGLAWIAEADCLPTPEVLAVGDTYLALRFIAPAARAANFDDVLGAGLAHLHQFGSDRFGLDQNGFLATLPQDNGEAESWPDFYVERRLRPLLRRAHDEGLVPGGWSRQFEALFSRMTELVGDEERVARLHGDLWSGNVHTDDQGLPVLIDPAAYGGHREVDLAMLQLFGSPSSDFFRAYNEVWPLALGHQSRVGLYQLYPLLAHLNLFGSSYLASCEQTLQQYL